MASGAIKGIAMRELHKGLVNVSVQVSKHGIEQHEWIREWIAGRHEASPCAKTAHSREVMKIAVKVKEWV